MVSRAQRSKHHVFSVNGMPAASIFTLKGKCIDLLLIRFCRLWLSLIDKFALLGFEDIVVGDDLDSLRLAFATRASLLPLIIRGLLILDSLTGIKRLVRILGRDIHNFHSLIRHLSRVARH